MIHDSVLLWAYGVNKTLEQGGAPDDGEHVAGNIFNSSIRGITGKVRNNHNTRAPFWHKGSLSVYIDSHNNCISCLFTLMSYLGKSAFYIVSAPISYILDRLIIQVSTFIREHNKAISLYAYM